MNTHRSIALILFFFAALAACAQSAINEALRAELLEMLRVDQEVRERAVNAIRDIEPGAPPTEEWIALVAEQNETDERNSRRLEEIIEEYGWPGRSLVGDDGAEAVSIILQHSNLERQRRYLPLLQAAVSAGELEGSRLALLEDRVRMREGQEQIYGTQIVMTEGAVSLYPVVDPQHLDERRVAIGLQPIEQYLQEAEAAMGQPIDRSALQKD